MTQQLINIGLVANDRLGDTWRDAFDKSNDNFTELYLNLNPLDVIITTKSDFPAPVSGIITLADTTRYIIAGAIDIGSDEIVYGTSSELMGVNLSISSLTSTTSGSLLTATSQVLRATQLTLHCPNGTLITVSSGNFLISNVVSFSFVNAATFTNAGSALIENCSIIGGTNGLSFSGSSTGNIVIAQSRFTGFSGTGLDLGTAVFDTFAVTNVIYSGLGGSTSVDGAAASANVTTRGSFFNCTFNGAGTALATIDIFDLKWTFGGNFGLQNSAADAGYSAQNNATVTTIASPDVPVKVDVGTLGASYRANRFTTANTGTTTYNGVEDIERAIAYTLTADTAAGSNNSYSFYIAINGTIITESKVQREFDSADPGAISIHVLSQLVTNDTIDIFVEADGHTTNITISDFSGIIT